jgi:hypothetical protein
MRTLKPIIGRTKQQLDDYVEFGKFSDLKGHKDILWCIMFQISESFKDTLLKRDWMWSYLRNSWREFAELIEFH